MKAFYFLLIFLSSSMLLNAQQFSTQFYFTDTLGNQDTVTVGFDPVATRGVDAAFGEVDMKEVPFGEQLEVRVGHVNDANFGCFPGFSFIENIDSDQSDIIVRNGKKEFSGLRCNNGVLEYINAGRMTFFVKNSALPMRMNWDTLAFTNTCLNQTFITDWHPNLWFDVTCGNDSLFFFKLNEITELWIGQPTNIQIVDRSGDTLSMVHIGWDGDFTSSTKSQALPTFQTFPNPAQDQLTIQLPDPKSRPWKLLNINGAIVKTGTINSATEQINLEDLTDGIYFLQVASFKAKRILVGLR